MTLNRRTLLGAAGASPLIWTVAFPALAQSPRDLMVMGMPIDDIVSLDPQESFEFILAINLKIFNRTLPIIRI